MGVTYAKYYSCENLNFFTITDVNKIVNCVTNLEGLGSRTASPADYYTLLFSNAVYANQPLKYGFMKVFISDSEEKDENAYVNLVNFYRANRIPFDSLNSNLGVMYEFYIYRDIIDTILRNNINPHFVKYLSGVEKTSSTNLIKFISDKSSINKDIITKNFKRNVWYMLNNKRFRPAITTETNVQGESFEAIEKIKFGFILNEGFREDSNVMIFEDFINQLIDYDWNRIKKALFQICTGIYSLVCTKTNHNDLNTKNVYIQIFPQTILNTYTINYDIFASPTDIQALIFDFDRAYHEGFQNKTIENQEALYENQTNEFHIMKDVAKIFESFIKNRNLTQSRKDEIYDILFYNDAGKLRWNDIFNNSIIISSDDYQYFNNFGLILRKLWTSVYGGVGHDLNEKSPLKFPPSFDSSNFEINNNYVCLEESFDEEGRFINFLKTKI